VLGAEAFAIDIELGDATTAPIDIRIITARSKVVF